MIRIHYAKSAIIPSAFIGCIVCTSIALAENWKTVVDAELNNGAGFSMTQEENWINLAGGVGGRFFYLSGYIGDGTRHGTATWTTTVPYCGMYQVNVSSYKTVNRTTDADYYFTTDYIPQNWGSGTGHTSINQWHDPSALTWDTIGSFYYEKGQKVTVKLDATDDNASDSADAVSWVLLSTEPCRSIVYAGAISYPTKFLLLNKEK